MDYVLMNNGRRYSDSVKNEAIVRRKEGYSLAEISTIFGITKNTASRWLRAINLTESARARIDTAEKQLDFWSKITDINKRQFNKPYRKINSGKRKRAGYQGCINVRYGSADLSRRLIAIAKAYLQHTGA